MTAQQDAATQAVAAAFAADNQALTAAQSALTTAQQQYTALASSTDAKLAADQDQIAALQAQLAALQNPPPPPPPPPPPTGKPAISASDQWWGRETTKLNYGRTYNQGDIKSLPSGVIPIHSFTDILGAGGEKGWPGVTSKVNAVNAELALLPDVPGVMITAVHEFDNPSKYGTDITSYLADEAGASKIFRAASAKRKNPFVIYRNPMEYSLTVTGQRGVLTALGSGDYDVQAWDVYCYTMQARYDALLAAIAKIGKPYIIPELGVRTTGSANDQEKVDTMNMAVSKLHTAKVLSWFDRKPINTLDPNPTTAANSPSGAALAGNPKANALWKSLVLKAA